MNNRMVIYTSVFLILVVGLVYLIASPKSQSKAEATVNQNQLVVDAGSFDFGIGNMKDGRVSHKFSIKNLGESLLVINKVYTSCMCTEAEVITSSGGRFGPYGMPGHGSLSTRRVEIAPNEDFVVEAIFDPAAHGPSGVGLASRTVYLETNSTLNPRLELYFSANVIN